MAYFLILGSVILAAVILWQLRTWKGDRQPTSHFRCPHCGQKLRFGPGSAGRKLMCPRCLRTCTLPQITEQASPDPQPLMTFQARRL
jgi:hypothetical protein